MLDFYWALSAAVFFAVVKNKILRFFIPLIAVFAVTCHTGGLLTFILLFSIVLLYEASREEKGSSRNVYLVLFAFTCAFSLLTFVYFTLFDEHNMKLSVAELDAFFEERGSQSHYYICSFYREEALRRFKAPADMITSLTGGAYADGSFLEKIRDLIKIHFWLYGGLDYKETFISAGILLALLFPQLAVYYGYFSGRLKDKNEDPIARFAFFCALALVPFVTAVSFFVSTDSIRWISYSFIMLVSFFIYVQYRENGSGLSYIRRRLEKVHPLLLTAYFLLYFFTVFNPYG